MIARLHTNTNNKQSIYPDAVHIIADLKTAIPKFDQHVKCVTRGGNILDKVYSNAKMGYRARPLVPVFNFLIPLKKTAPTITKTVTIWLQGSSQQLQDQLRYL